jgi:alpha-mannosidase
MRSQLRFEKQYNPSELQIDPGFVADELTVLQKYLEAFEPEKLDILAKKLEQIDWNVVTNAEKCDRFLLDLRQSLHSLSIKIKQRSFHLLGHAHLDMAWLWTTSETWDAAQRTFASVLNLQKDFSELTFCHTSPALYAWIEKYRPDLFKSIQDAVRAKSWEVVGGMWIEPEVTLISGESLVRQLLYGQRYTKEKFGTHTKVAWLPDSFGFTWQLPQIFKQSGIEYFVTGKLHWNDSTKFPHGVFWWQSPDGTQLLTLMSPPNVTGVMDTNPITMVNYAVDWEKQTGLKDAFWLPGVGDHGGGPSRDMLEVQQRWQQSPFFPQIKFTTAIEYLSSVIGHWSFENQQRTIPVWNDELYLEFHRGCYTTHADQKQYNRRCEELLYQAELWSSLATITLGKTYPKKELEESWKKTLFNQFHDILPGTSIPEVFIEANQDWQQVEQIGKKILDESLEAIASQIILPPPPHPKAQPIVVFNSLNWQRSEVVSFSIPSGDWEIYDLEGQKVLSQLLKDNQLLFLANEIPSIGYRLFWLCPKQGRSEGLFARIEVQQEFVLENEYLKVIIDPKTGDISSIFDKNHQREVLKNGGNQLQAFEDKGQYWDAWNIDPNYAQYPLPPAQLKSIEYLEQGALQWRIRVIKKLNNSEFCQDYILQANSPILKIATTVDWQETHVMVKAAFPLTVENDFATYEIPCGVIQRPTNPQTPAEKAKWEVYALHWADLTDRSQEYGVSLLNNCKYGYDAQSDRLRLTLLRSPQWPHRDADRGIHHFTYAIYPHQGSWQSARTVHHGYELNVPLKVLLAKTNFDNSTKSLPATNQLLDLQARNLILMAFKQSEDNANAWILRCYECHGQTAQIPCENQLGLAIANSVDLLEQSTKNLSQIEPWKIVSYQLEVRS